MCNREKLRKLAEAATPGPWEADGGEISQHWSSLEPWLEIVGKREACGPYCYGGTAGVERTEDAEFIAAANPASVLGLLDQLDAAEAKLAAVRALHFGEYVEDDDRNRCFECGDEWPCPTIRALDGEAAHQLATEGTDDE